jgi:cystathionine beta-synthase
MDGKIDYFIAGVGTGGTVGGVAKFLKEKDPDIKVIAIDPEGSIFYDYFKTGKITQSSPYLIEGLGDEFLIHCADFTHVDDMYRVSDRDSFHYARKLMKEEGILGGGSSGAALWGALKLAESIPGPARIATIFADGAARYLSSIFNDDWMKEKGFPT